MTEDDSLPGRRHDALAVAPREDEVSLRSLIADADRVDLLGEKLEEDVVAQARARQPFGHLGLDVEPRDARAQLHPYPLQCLRLAVAVLELERVAEVRQDEPVGVLRPVETH